MQRMGTTPVILSDTGAPCAVARHVRSEERQSAPHLPFFLLFFERVLETFFWVFQNGSAFFSSASIWTPFLCWANVGVLFVVPLKPTGVKNAKVKPSHCAIFRSSTLDLLLPNGVFFMVMHPMVESVENHLKKTHSYTNLLTWCWTSGFSNILFLAHDHQPTIFHHLQSYMSLFFGNFRWNKNPTPRNLWGGFLRELFNLSLFANQNLAFWGEKKRINQSSPSGMILQQFVASEVSHLNIGSKVMGLQ